MASELTVAAAEMVLRHGDAYALAAAGFFGGHIGCAMLSGDDGLCDLSWWVAVTLGAALFPVTAVVAALALASRSARKWRRRRG